VLFTYPVQAVATAVDKVTVRDIEADFAAVRIQLHVRVEAVRAHEVAQLDGLLRGRGEGLGARVLGEEVRLRGSELVRGVRGEVGEDLDWVGGLAEFVQGEVCRREISQRLRRCEFIQAKLYGGLERHDFELFERSLCPAWYHSRRVAIAGRRWDNLLCTAR
jgi:hypothetical protein